MLVTIKLLNGFNGKKKTEILKLNVNFVNNIH